MLSPPKPPLLRAWYLWQLHKIEYQHPSTKYSCLIGVRSDDSISVSDSLLEDDEEVDDYIFYGDLH